MGVSETDQEEMSLLSTWDYNADEFHILVRECFLLEKRRKKSLDSDPVIEKQTKTQLNACQNSFFRWLYFCFCVVCACMCVCVCMRVCTSVRTRKTHWHTFLPLAWLSCQGGLTLPEQAALKLPQSARLWILTTSAHRQLEDSDQ